jgi:hypothetical protein
MTRELLAMLKPGGRLLFNAPNRNACVLQDQLWVDLAPPPDLVTMYRPGYWRKYLGDLAEVVEEIEYEPPQRNLIIIFRKLAGRRWKRPLPIALSESSRVSAPAEGLIDIVFKNVERVVLRIGSWTRLDRLAPAQPTEFGLLVTMRKR